MQSQNARNADESPSPIPNDEKVSIISLAVMHRPLHKKQKTHQLPEFNLEDMTSACTATATRNPFKLLSFKEEKPPQTPSHRRQPSMLVKQVRQKYNLNQNIENAIQREAQHRGIQRQELSASSESVKPRKLNSSTFASTLEPKSSIHNSELRNLSLLESETEQRKESMDSEIGNRFTTAMTQHSQNNSPRYSNDFGVLPIQAYCENCDDYVTTSVSIKMPTLPTWKVVCCVGDFLKCCSNPEEWDKYQEIYHVCSNCMGVIYVLHPPFF